MFAGAAGPRYAEMIERRLGNSKDKPLTVGDVAAVFKVGETKVREWIEEGRLPAANLNAGMSVAVDAARPELGRRALRPLWRMTYEAVLGMAREMEAGI